ncbi:MAG TPA: hypothetical protein VHZ28_13575 [Terracidiphilus sp.]|nr:hypothetical protein [Terracidiphilus sp.]
MTSTALFASGVLVPNQLMQSQLGEGGDTLNIPSWLDLASVADPGGSDPYFSDDNPAHLSVPSKIAAINHVVRKTYANNSWAAASFAGELAGSDPMQRIAERVNAYWDRTYEYRLIKSLYGILLSNVANNSGDLVVDISAATADVPVTINGTDYTSPSFSRNAVIDAAFTMGDRASDFKAIALHSSIVREAAKNNEIETIRDADNNILFQTYAGMAVLQDDGLALAAGKYLSVIFGGGAVGFASGDPSTGYGTEVFRLPNQGYGGGVTELYSRRNSIIHPYGFSFLSGSVAAASPTSAELALAANWARVVPQRKQVPLCFLVTT